MIYIYIYALLDEINRRKRTLRAVASRLGYPLLMRMLRDRAAELLSARIDWKLADSATMFDPHKRENVVCYCSLATAAALKEWITGELPLRKEDLADFLISSFSQRLHSLVCTA